MSLKFQKYRLIVRKNDRQESEHKKTMKLIFLKQLFELILNKIFDVYCLIERGPHRDIISFQIVSLI